LAGLDEVEDKQIVAQERPFGKALTAFGPTSLPDGVNAVDYAPFSELFPAAKVACDTQHIWPTTSDDLCLW